MLSIFVQTVAQPFSKTARFLRESEAKKGIEAEGGIAQPGVAIVPVALSADSFRQAKRRRGNHRAVFLAAQQFQHKGRTVYDLAPAAFVTRTADPFAPVMDRLLKMAFDLVRIKNFDLRVGLSEGKCRRLTWLQREVAHRIVTVEFQRDSCMQGHLRAIRMKAHCVLCADGLMSAARVVKTRRAAHMKPDLTLNHAQDANDLVGINFAFFPGQNRHEIREFDDACFRQKPRQQNICVWQIELFGAQIFKLWLNAERPAILAVQQRSKYCRRVEFGKAEEVNCTLRACQRDGSHVPNYAIIFNPLHEDGLSFPLPMLRCAWPEKVYGPELLASAFNYGT